MGQLEFDSKIKIKRQPIRTRVSKKYVLFAEYEKNDKFDLLSLGPHIYAYDSLGRCVQRPGSDKISTINNDGELFQRFWLSGKYVKIFLEHLSLDGLQLTPKMLSNICQNCQTLQVYTLNEGICYKNLKTCQELLQPGFKKNTSPRLTKDQQN